MSSKGKEEPAPAQVALEYPKFVQEKIQEISTKTSVTVEALKQDYESIFRDPFIQQDEQFKTDDERHKFASATLWSRYVGRAPLFETQLIPVGVAPKRLSKKGSTFASLFVLRKHDKSGQMILSRVSFQGDSTQALSTITMFSAYKVKLGKFKNSEDFINDVRTKWEFPSALQAKPADILSRIQSIKRVTISKASNFPTLKDSTGYENTLDWRVIRGLVWRKNNGIRKDGTEWCNYTIGDQETGREDRVAQDGKILPAGFTVWCDKLCHGFNVEDECDFFGTVSIDKQGQTSMNAFQVLPVHARRQ